MSFKDKKPDIISEGYYYDAKKMDEYLAIVEPMAEKLEAIMKLHKELGWLTFTELKEILEPDPTQPDKGAHRIILEKKGAS